MEKKQDLDEERDEWVSVSTKKLTSATRRYRRRIGF